MNYQNVCLGPYEIDSPHFKKKVRDNTFVSSSKTRQVAIISDKGVITPPASDAILLHEELGNTHDIRWYECPSEKGRTYTVLPTACEILITSFENGFDVKGEMDATIFGADRFCYGNTYTSDGSISESDRPCQSSIEFDGYIFQISGNVSGHSGEYDCGDCWDDTNLFADEFDEESGQFGVTTSKQVKTMFIRGACCWVTQLGVYRCDNFFSEDQCRRYVTSFYGIFKSFIPETLCLANNACPPEGACCSNVMGTSFYSCSDTSQVCVTTGTILRTFYPGRTCSQLQELGICGVSVPTNNPPTPDPMSFSTPPIATSTTTIEMTATNAVDPEGSAVEYYFQNGSSDASGWQSSRAWVHAGLVPGTAYSYKVKARDSAGNETDWSTALSATTISLPDTEPPTPNPPRWLTDPGGISQNQIFMAAEAGSDNETPSNLIKYLFECTSGGFCSSSGWIATNSYTDSGLSSQTSYTYRFKMRDEAGNETEWSTSKSGTTLSAPITDTTAPLPNPAVWLLLPQPTSPTSIRMQATPASDPNGVEYQFDCVSGGCTSSGWQTSSVYEDAGLDVGESFSYRVRYRDGVGNVGNWSTTASATTEDDDTTPPSPNPPLWEDRPYATGRTSIRMTAQNAFDLSGVEYTFECITDLSKSSGWQSSRTFSASGLTAGTEYNFRFKVRDKSENNNETGWSSQENATTFGGSATGSPLLDECASQDDPQTVTRPSGDTLTAYTARDEDGTSQVRLHRSGTTQQDLVLYYRQLSYGCLLNSHEPEFSSVTFEVYDDFVLEGEPSLGVGFLTGPLAGETYHVQSIGRGFQPNGKPKFTLEVQATSEDLQFPDGNDICDIEWFLVDGGLSPFAEGIGTIYKAAVTPPPAEISLMALPCSNMGGTAVDEKDFNQLRGNVMEIRGDRRIGRIEMQFQVDQPTLAYWYIARRTTSQQNFSIIMQKVTTINDTTMTIHDSGDIEVTVRTGLYLIGCILKYPVSTFKREQSGSSTYLDNSIPATVWSGVTSRWIVPPCYPVFPDGIFISDYSPAPRYWMNLCFDDTYVGDDFPGPPDGSFETGEFIIGDPNTSQSRSESNRYCGNSINPRVTYGGGTHNTSRWLNRFDQYIKAKSGQKLYFIIWSSEITPTSDFMRPVWIKEVIADSNDAKWYSSGNINFELKIQKNYSIGVSVREPIEDDNTGFDTQFYYTSFSQTFYFHFFGASYYSNVIKQIPPSNYSTSLSSGDENILFLQKWVIGSDDGSSMDAPSFCKDEWIGVGAPTASTTGSGFKTHGLVTSNNGYQVIPDNVQVKNWRAWLEVPAGYINPEVYFYILKRTQGSNYFTPIWESGPRTIIDPLGNGFEGFVYASDTDIVFDDSSDVVLHFGSKIYLFAVSWQNTPISMGLKNEIQYLGPCSYIHKLMSNSIGPPYPPAQQQFFAWGGTEIPIIDIQYSVPGGDPGDPVGACCFADGSCINLTEVECNSVNADWNAGQDCATFSCIQLPTGACCLAPERGYIYIPPVCVGNLTEEQCHALGAFGVGMTNSTYKGDGSVCTSSTCLTGACCFGPSPSWTCEDRLYSSCNSSGGVWRWPGSQCDQLALSGTECDSYFTGACCVETGIEPHGCIDVDESTCDSYGANKIKWAGDNTRCSEVNCGGVGLGACCYGNAQCELLSELDCITIHGDNFGEWQGEFTTCGGQCPNRGICCLPDNTCIFTTPEDCEIQSGVYIRDGGSCVGFSCTEPRGACCFPNGVCEENVTSEECSNNQGTYLGDDSTCIGADCEVQTNIGACCLIDGTCFVGTREECLASTIESEYQGDGTFCSGSSAVECPVIDLTSDEALIIPDHTYLGDIVPSSKPSLAVAKNHLMLDGSQYQYIAYQAFEKNQWNVYLRQVRTVINNRESSDPQYQAPFNILERPTFDLSPLLESDFNQLKYTVVDNAVTSPPESNLCAMFKVSLSDGRGVFNCDKEASGEWTASCSYGSEFPQTDVYVESVYDTNSCGAGFDKWAIGATFQGPFPPTPDVLGDAGSGCVTISAKYPSTVDEWCYLQSNCIQSSLIADDLCPSPYLGITYKPEDMWTLDNDGDTVTRVKYHLGINILSTAVDTIISGDGISGRVDFMFVIDYSASMEPRINAVRSAVAPFAQELKNAGIDARFGLCVYGRADSDDNPAVTPSQPADAFICPDATSVDNQAMFDGLIGFASGGFTKDVSTLSAALNHWFYAEGAQAPGYSAVQFASLDPRFDWRPDASRYIMLITDATDSENNAVCPTYSNNQQAAINVVSDNTSGTNASVILAICDGNSSCGGMDGTGYVPMSQASDWGSNQYFSVVGPYDIAFQSIFGRITSDLLQATVVERDDVGFDSTYLKPAEIIITYSGDLTDLWTQDKNQLAFVDNPPSSTGLFKDLVNIPFEMAGSIYGIDPVHLNGFWERWVYFAEPGNIQLDWPNIGVQKLSRSNPIQISANAINAKIAINNRNDLFIAYESLEYGMNHIVIKGTGDFAQDSITGPKGQRITRFLVARDFAYEHYITLPGEGVNQLCDLVVDKNDVLHVVWQSNRDGYWEIYYANGKNKFDPVRVTKSESRSGHPAIDVDGEGNIFVVYHDNRFGPFEVMLSYKDEDRTLPLLQQDAYLGGYRSGYNHYTNILPILVENPQELAPVPGQLWGSRSQCPETRFEIILRTSLRTSFSQTLTNPYGGHQITNPGDLPGGGSHIYVEIWATTHNNNGFGPVGVDLDYDATYFTDPQLQSGSGFSRWWWLGALTPTIHEAEGVVNDIGGSSNPDSSIITPYWGLVGVVQLTRRPGVTIPSDANIIFSVADVFDPSSGSSTGIRDSNNNELSDISFDSVNVTNTKEEQKDEYSCLHANSFVYDIEEETGSIGSPDGGVYNFRQGGGSIGYKLAALAGSTTGQFYGITEGGTLLLLDDSSNDPYIYLDVSEITEIGQIDLPNNYSVLDAAVDTEGFHIWVMMGGYDDLNTSNILLLQINPEDASIIRQSTIYTNVDEIRGSIACTSGGDFHLITYRNGSTIFSSASYPALGISSALFDFDNVNEDVGSDLEPGSEFLYDMTANYADTIFVIDDQKKYYTLDKSGGNLTFIDSLNDPDDLLTSNGILMLSSIGGLGYQFTGRTRNIADEDYFNVIIEFYDNKALEGEPSLVIDSRDNVEAFINDRVFQDEYVSDEYESSAKGIKLAAGESGYMFFEASHYRPGYANKSYPYGFEKNKAYFPKAFSVNEAGGISEVTSTQTVSFSCNKCSAMSDNSFDSGGCSYSFIITNDSFESRYFNFKVDFYADEDKKSIVKRFNLLPGENDLSYCEVDNQPASGMWSSSGLLMQPGDVKFVQVYPSLDPSAGFLCGVKYYMIVLSCASGSGVCSDEEFGENFSDAEWDSANISDSVATFSNERATDILQIQDKLAIAYRANDGYLKYAEFDDGAWTIESIEKIVDGGVSLTAINGQPAIAYSSAPGYTLKYAIRDSITKEWNISVVDDSPGGWYASLININDTPAIAYWGNLAGYPVKRATNESGTWEIKTVVVTNQSYSYISEIGHAVIDDKPVLTFANSDNWYYYTLENGSWTSKEINVGGQKTRYVALVNYNNQPFIVYRSGFISDASGFLRWARSSDEGDTWPEHGIVDGSQNGVGEYTTLKVIAGRPSVVYATNSYPYDIKFARLVDISENRWNVVTVDEDVSYSSGNPRDNRKGLTGFNNQVAIFTAINPMRVYLSDPERVVSGIKPTYFCECSSFIFGDDRLMPISEIGRWHSSAYGHADTRITDTPGDSLRPDIVVRRNNNALVTFEDHSAARPVIKASSFRVSPRTEGFGSGFRNWYDIESGLNGKNVSTALDFNEFISLAYEQMVEESTIVSELPNNQILLSQLDYRIEDDRGRLGVGSGVEADRCNVEALEDNIISSDPFLAQSVIKKIRVKDDYVQYFTTKNGVPTPVVNVCEIDLDVVGSPEVIAIRVRNETGGFSSWCPWRPTIGDYTTSIPHNLTKGSGEKEICVQAMTYNGVTTEFCVPVLADYKKIVFGIKLYSDDQYESEIRRYDGFYVASITDEEGTIGTGGEAYKTVYIQIIPSEPINARVINFDVIQQGIGDIRNKEAVYNEEKQLFEGSFDVYQEDKIVNIDGVARIRAKLPGTCEEVDEIVVASATFSKDIYNVMSDESSQSVDQSVDDDVFDNDRNTVTGRLGPDITIRPTSDPFLVFGDPNYYLKKDDWVDQSGIQSEDE